MINRQRQLLLHLAITFKLNASNKNLSKYNCQLQTIAIGAILCYTHCLVLQSIEKRYDQSYLVIANFFLNLEASCQNMLELDSGCTPPKWKRPEDVMKMHRMKMKKRALQARFVKSMDVNIPGEVPTGRLPILQRSPAKNPFR